jgi:glycosyltransferase involved in cell wall biosynthesis
MQWSYGVTTVPSRFATTLPRTLCSLAAGGFDAPRLFVDGAAELPPRLANYAATCHVPKVRTWMNWVLGMTELYGRMPAADRYVIFQDDVICVSHLREYLESIEFPARGYLNLYTELRNERDRSGFYQSNQLGLGALGLVFDNEGLRRLLRTPHFVNRPHPKFLKPGVKTTRTWKAIDGGIVESMRKAGYREYVHRPSLLNHIGVKSSMGNGQWPSEGAATFPGESFDARELSVGRLRATGPASAPTSVVRSDLSHQVSPSDPSTSDNPRLGLVGYNCASGLGTLNRQIATYLPITSWLVKPHRHLPTLQPVNDHTRLIVSRTGEGPVREFLNSVDCVIFCETPYYQSLVRVAREMGKHTFCVPMQEWLPPEGKGWPEQVDLFLCPTQHCYDQFSKLLPCVYWPCPIDTRLFPFQQRHICRRFLFLNGSGGLHDRKGSEVVKAALKLWPEMPLTVRSQATTSWPAGVDVLPPATDHSLLYSVGDVLISPHRCDGIGLEPLEAAAAGMPAILTDGQPWNEFPSLAKVKAAVKQRMVNRLVDWYEPDAESLMDACQAIVNSPIAEQSLSARQWATSRSWEAAVGPTLDIIFG